MYRPRILLCFALLLSACTGGSGSAVPHASVRRAKQAPQEVFPLPVIDVRGDPAALGTAYGQALGQPMHRLFDSYLKPFFHSDVERFIALTAAKAFEPYIDPQHLAEAEALAKQTEVGVADLLLAQCFLDLMPMNACSTITLPAAASPDGIARFGRNLDFPSRSVLDKDTVVIIYHPAGRYAFASVTWPGLIGVLSGMNEHGLTLANMEVTRGGAPPRAMPYMLLYRSVLEQCRTVDEAIAFIERTPRQTSNNLMLMDAAGRRAVVELTPARVTIRRGDNGAALISTNHHRGADSDTPGRCWRYDLLHDATQDNFGHVDIHAIEKMLSKVVQGREGSMTVQSMVFEPATRTLYLAAGANAPAQGYHKLDLQPHFASHAGQR